MSRKTNNTTNKNITVIPAAGGAYSDLSIAPGTTALDLKAQLGLGPDMVLTRGKGSEPMQDQENVYETVADGAKLYSSSDVQWGGA